VKTVFTGYESLAQESTVRSILMGDKASEEVSEGATAQIITVESPFYGESGGQVGDKGWMEGVGGKAEVIETLRPLPDVIVHHVKMLRGRIVRGETVKLAVDVQRRRAIAANHTATHILQHALREILGDHVHQEGSLVSAERFRFDFTHFSPLTENELIRVEEIVNLKILENAPVTVEILSLEEALQRNAMALFGEKYGDRVRMVAVGEYSRELCGGTHAESSGTIGFLKVVSESGVAAGVRRIEAVTGMGAWRYVRTWQEELEELGSILKTPKGELGGKVKRLLEEEKRLHREIEALKAQVANSQSRDLLDEAKIVQGIKVLAVKVEIADPRTIRDFADQLRERLGSGVIVVGAKDDTRALLTVMVSKDLTGRFHAGKIINEIAAKVGGRGGGRPDMAQAGGPHPEKLEEALHAAYELIAGIGS
jgi:alanyl-tRNA synthetase